MDGRLVGRRQRRGRTVNVALRQPRVHVARLSVPDLPLMRRASRVQVGVPIDAFIKNAMAGLDEGLDEVAVCPEGKRFREVINDEKFSKMFEMLQQH